MRAERVGTELVLQADVFNEQVVLAAAMHPAGAEFLSRVVRQPPDVFRTPQHAAAWTAIREAHRQRLQPDVATLQRLSGNGVDVAYLVEVLQARPDLPAQENLRAAVEALLRDHQRHKALTGPVSALLEAVVKGADDERVKGLARAVAASFDGVGDRRYLLDPAELVRSQIEDIRQRMRGRNVYPFGIDGFDYYQPAPGQAAKSAGRRIIPGAAPKRVTVVTGLTKSGKSTFTARCVLGLARQKRRVLYGAWEKTGGMTLELLACMSLGWSRKALIEGNLPGGEADLAVLEERMTALSQWVRFMDNPFRRTVGERTTNERNLDLLHGYVADAGPDVVVLDLFERCLVNDEPSEEKRALFRVQAMTLELNVHTIIVAQQRKDVAQRLDPHPTEEGIKGSGAWGEIADNIFGVYRQYLHKPVPDNTVEIDVIKQRDGKDMLAVEFEWDADRGLIAGGTAVEYPRPGAAQASGNSIDQRLREPRKRAS